MELIWKCLLHKNAHIDHYVFRKIFLLFLAVTFRNILGKILGFIVNYNYNSLVWFCVYLKQLVLDTIQYWIEIIKIKCADIVNIIFLTNEG